MTSIMILTALVAMSVKKVYLVSDVPEYPGFMNTWAAGGAVPALGSEYEVSWVKPDCVNCQTVVNMTDAGALEYLLSSTWNATELEAAVTSAIGGDKPCALTSYEACLVLTVGTTLATSLSSGFPRWTFVELQLKNGLSSSSVRNVNHISLNVETTTGSYMAGVISSLAATNGVRKIGIMYQDGSDRTTDTAFWQGVSDADPKVCVSSKAIKLDVSGKVWDEAQFTAVKTQASDYLQEGIDVLFTRLGAYDSAVLSAVNNRSESNYVVFGVTEAESGGTMNRSHLRSVALTKVDLDWAGLLGWVVAQKEPMKISSIPISSLSSWTNTNANSLVPLTKASEEMHTNCTTTNTITYYNTIISVQANVTARGMLRFTNERPSANCAKLPIYVQSTRDVIQGCILQEKNVRLVGVGMYINNLGNVDMKAGSFYVDFNLYLHQSRAWYSTLEQAEAVLQANPVCTGGLCSCPDFGQNEWENYIPTNKTGMFDSIVNLVNIDRMRTVTPVLKTDTVGTADVLVDYFRVQGTQYFRPHLQKWPMDTQSLKIILEDLSESTTDTVTLKFCHMENFAGLSTNARYFPGMELQVGAESPWKVDVLSTCWPYLKYPEDYVTGVCTDGVNQKPVRYDRTALPDGDESCTCLGGTKASSRYAMEILFDRPTLPSFMKTFLPAIFITIVNQGVWFLYPKVFETRLGVCGSSLISGVMYHVSVTSNTPETSVLTWADRFMVVVYYNNLVAFTTVFYQTILHQANMERLAWRSFRLTRLWGPLVAAASFTGVGVMDDAKGILIWIFVSTFSLGVFVYFVGDFCLHLFSRKWLAFLHRRNDDITRAGHISSTDECNIPLTNYDTVN